MKVKRVDWKLVGAILLANKKAAQHNAQRTKKPNGSYMGNAGSIAYSKAIGRSIKLHELEKGGLLENHRSNDNNEVKTPVAAVGKAEPKRDPEAEESILKALSKYKESFWVRKLVKEKVITITVSEGSIRVTGVTDSRLTRDAVTDCIQSWQKKYKNTFKVENRLTVSSEEAAFRSESRATARGRRSDYAKYHNRTRCE